MTDENAALEQEPNTIPEDQGGEVQDPPEESAPSPAEPPETDAVQKRINKLVGQRHEEERARKAAEQRAQELEAKLQSQEPAKPTGAPKLEDFDYDDAKYQEALIDYKVNEKAKEFQKQQEDQAAQDRHREIQNKWNSKLESVKEDYQETIQHIPVLPNDTLLTLMQADNGPDVAYYLGKHLDVADEISRMSPMLAAMKIGQISVQLSNTNPSTKPSAAPDPIEPINSGGTASAERGPKNATFE